MPQRYNEGDHVEIQMQPVESSAILAAGYDQDANVLAVQFVSHLMDGMTYMFRPVPQEVWEAFLEAPSKGKFFHEHIRSNIGPTIDGGYEWCSARGAR